MKLKENQILVSAYDHGYRVCNLFEGKAVFNHHVNEWYEYAGDEYLGEGDEVFEVRMAQ